MSSAEPHDNESDLEKMKNRLCSLFHGLRSNMGDGETKRKLILHFDVNKTIVPVDSATGETVEAALNVFLSGMAWGKDRQGEWHSKEKLSSVPQEVDDVSFYKFVERRLLPDVTCDRSAFRYQLTSFTDKPQGSNFKPYLNTLLQGLKWNLPYEERAHKLMTVPGTKECRYHFIVPAFYNLLRHLVEEGRDFAVIFRTFGNDVNSVLTSVKSAIKHNMPFCQSLESLSDNMGDNVSFLKRDPMSTANFTIQDDGEKRKTNENESANANSSKQVLTEEDMYTWFTNMKGFCAIRDNVEEWYQNSFDSRKGKPFWVDLCDDQVQHVFFDDNIRPGSPDSILNLRIRDQSTTGSSFKDVARDQEYLYELSNMVPVNFPEAILNENYFIEKLGICEENYSKRLDALRS